MLIALYQIIAIALFVIRIVFRFISSFHILCLYVDVTERAVLQSLAPRWRYRPRSVKLADECKLLPRQQSN